jgi:hypothetical protein
MPLWLQAVVMVAAGVVAFVKGVKAGRPWGKHAVAACGFGVVAAFIGVLYWYLIVVLLALLLFGYVKGVRQQKEWGKLLVVVGAVGILVLVVANGIGVRVGSADSAELAQARKTELAYARAEMIVLGKYLADKQPNHKVLLLLCQPGDGYMRKYNNVIAEGLEEGFAGRLTLAAREEIAQEPIRPGTALEESGITPARFDEAVLKHRDCDMIVSTLGIPFRYEKTKVSQMPDGERPRIVLSSGPGEMPPDLDNLLKTGHITAFVRTNMDAVRSDKEGVPDDPAEAFRQRYLLMDAASVKSP